MIAKVQSVIADMLLMSISIFFQFRAEKVSIL